MEITHYIAPRQTGKTTKAVEVYNQDPMGTYLVVPNSEMRNYVSRSFNIPRNKIVTPYDRDVFVGVIIRRLIFDEYLIMYHSGSRLLTFLNRNLPAMPVNGDIIAFSSPNNLYTQQEIESNEMLWLNDQQPNINVIQINQQPNRWGFLNISDYTLEFGLRNYGSDIRYKTEGLGFYRENDDHTIKFTPYFKKPKKFLPR